MPNLQNLDAGGSFEVTEVALVPQKQWFDKLLWWSAKYRDRYWRYMELSSAEGNKIIKVDRENNQILIEWRENNE